MTNKISLVALGAALTAAGVSASAGAQTVGSVSLGTHRSCATTASTTPCGGELPGQQTVSRTFGGGIGVAGYNEHDIGGGNKAWSNISFGAYDLPLIRAYTAAPGNVRMNINAFGFQSYTYTGSGSTPFALAGNLHIVNSSASGPGGTFDVDGDGVPEPLDGGRYPGGSIATAYVGVWDVSILAGYTSATSPEVLFNDLFYRGCGTAGVLGAGLFSSALSGGERNISVATSSCTPTSLNLVAGQEVLVVAGLQLPVNRGGFADATATFRTDFDRNQLTNAEVSNLRNNLSSAVDQGAPVAFAAVPEPAAWGMMIAGFGLLGAGARRRRGYLAHA